jgi:hypothetical protein
MDTVEKMAFDSELCAAVLGKGPEFMLIFLDLPLDGSVTAMAHEKGYAYCGILAVINGEAMVECEPNPAAVFTVLKASLKFAQKVADKLWAKNRDTDWLERLYALPDTRD